MMMQAHTACIIPFCARFFGKGILASSFQDVLIPPEGKPHLLLCRLFGVGNDCIGSAIENQYCTSVCINS